MSELRRNDFSKAEEIFNKPIEKAFKGSLKEEIGGILNELEAYLAVREEDKDRLVKEATDSIISAIKSEFMKAVGEDKFIDSYVEFGCEQPHDDYASEKGYNQRGKEITQKIKEM